MARVSKLSRTSFPLKPLGNRLATVTIGKLPLKLRPCNNSAAMADYLKLACLATPTVLVDNRCCPANIFATSSSPFEPFVPLDRSTLDRQDSTWYAAPSSHSRNVEMRGFQIVDRHPSPRFRDFRNWRRYASALLLHYIDIV